MKGRDAGYSARFGGVSAWAFGDTFSERAPDYYGLAHPEYDAARGRRIYVSTSHPVRTDIFRMPTRLFEVTLRR